MVMSYDDLDNALKANAPWPQVPDHWHVISILYERATGHYSRRVLRLHVEFKGHADRTVWLVWDGLTWEPSDQC